MTENSECKPHTQRMSCDEKFVNVLTWRTIGSIEGDCLVWRFITTEGRPITVRPVQLPSNARPLCVPHYIRSTLRNVCFMIGQVHGFLPGCGFDPDPPDKSYRPKENTLYHINMHLEAFTGKQLVPVPRKPKGGYTAEQRDAIVKLLTDPKDSGATKLEAIRVFILKTYKPEFSELLHIRDDALRHVLKFIGEQVEQDVTISTVRRFVDMAKTEMFTEIEKNERRMNPDKKIASLFAQWVQETVKTRKIPWDEAEQFLAERIVFIAMCEGRQRPHFYPIEDITQEMDVMDGEDLVNFTNAGGKLNQRVTPQVEPNARQAPEQNEVAHEEQRATEKQSRATGIEAGITPITSAQSPTSPVAVQTGDTRELGRLAQAQQMLSGGILLTIGPLVEKMTPADRLLFNLLTTPNPKRKGWALGYREISECLGGTPSHTEIGKRHRKLEKKYGREITRFIAEARQNQTRGGKINPDRCDSGRKINTKPPPENPREGN